MVFSVWLVVIWYSLCVFFKLQFFIIKNGVFGFLCFVFFLGFVFCVFSGF